jgi:hypothetical protein
VLDHVERRRLLVEPTREDAAPPLVWLLDVELDECSSQLFLFPGRGRLAGPQAHDHILPAHRLTRVQGDVLHDAIALVEDPDHGDALGHRRDPSLAGRGRRRLPRPWQWRVLLLAFLSARGERERDQQRCRDPFHAYSGIQGS